MKPSQRSSKLVIQTTLTRGITALLLIIFIPASRGQSGPDPNEGSLSALKPRLPEPMVFDLVRPLGAEKGEIEVNTLFFKPLTGGGRELHWAPEVEVAITESMAIEFEVPVVNDRISEYKFAFQQTFGLLAGGKAIHGWQGIARFDRPDGHLTADLLYLYGIEIDRRWSVFTMNGMRRESTASEQGFAAVSNATVFQRISQHVVFGVESNWKVGGPTKSSWLLMPQSHFRLVDRLNLQVGGGMERRSGRATRGVAGWRLIREF